jgi:hypothetical protein
VNPSVAAPLNRLAVLTLIGIFGIGIIAIGYHWLHPIRVNIPHAHRHETESTFFEHERGWSVADFEGVWSKRLLADPPPMPIENVQAEKPKTPEVVTPPTPIPLRLESILYSENTQIAVFRPIQASKNEIVRLGIGESYLGVHVHRIEPELVSIEFNSRVVELKLKEK